MANTIANLSVKLSANISGFSSGLANAAKPLTSFASSVGGAALKIGALAGAGAALIAGGSIAALVHNSMEAIDVNAKLADRLGLTTEGLVGLQHAAGLAGIGNEQLTGALEKMLKSLSGAADDGELASNAFTKLGLDASKLANLPADEAFAQIAQKLSEIKNPAERAAAAMQIFGKSGQALMPLLMSGAEGIKAAQQEAEKLGLTYSRVDAAKVEAANDAITRAASIIKGVGNQLAIGLAPYIDAAAAKLTELGTSGGGIGPKVGGAIEWVVSAIATAADYLNLGVAGFKLLQAGGTLAVLGLVKSIDLLGQGIVWVINKLTGGKMEFTSFFGQMSDGLIQDVDRLTTEAGAAFKSFADGDASKAAGRMFQGIRDSAQKSAEGVADSMAGMKGAFEGLEDSTANLKKVADALKDLNKQVQQAGMTEGQKKLDDLKALGATPEQLAEAEKNLNKLSALEQAQKKQQDLQEKAKSVIESVMSPMEKFTQREAEVSELLNNGLISWDQYGKAIANARKELEQTDDANAPAAPDLIKAGSAAAQRFAFDATRGQQKLSRDQYAKQAVDEQQTTNKLLERVAKGVEGGVTGGIAVVEL